MGRRILCVAEKPSIAKAVANHLAGNGVRTQGITGNPYVKNYNFDYRFNRWGNSSVTFTSVVGHLTGSDFQPPHNNWNAVPASSLFEAPIKVAVDTDKKPISKNLEQNARNSDVLFIWTDCDREGEHIGSEIRDIVRKIKPGIEVKRAKFSNIERDHVMQAANSPIDMDEQQVDAVNARIELDLRLGSAFTRLQTLALKDMILPVNPDLKVISYGSCQFPTLGFVVDRYFRVKNFKPEPFWGIKVTHRKDNVNVNFSWARGHLFDRMAATLMFERCLGHKKAKVTKMQTRPTSKWRPLPLTTVELQKLGTRFLRMSSAQVMTVAEKLYNKGFVSYPRTETDQFPKEMDLRKLVEKQMQSGQWGEHAQTLFGGAFKQPRAGRNNDQAHPPIHPVNFVAPNALDNDEERRVYEFIARRFLACCSEDAKGQLTELEIEWGVEKFSAKGLRVLERNYLEVYPYEKWESSQQLPHFDHGETFVPTEAKITEGKTTSPSYLTEPELIALMDANGIGTDATMADHIQKIKDRDYVMTRPVSGGRAAANNTENERGGRGRGGVATGARGGNSGVQELIPTVLGVALIEGYENMGFDTSLGKPHLRKEMELQMKAICAGTKTKYDVVQANLEQYRHVFTLTNQKINVLKSAIRKYVLQQQE